MKFDLYKFTSAILYTAVVSFYMCCYFFFNDTATTDIYTYLHTLSLHDALPICTGERFNATNDRLFTLDLDIRAQPHQFLNVHEAVLEHGLGDHPDSIGHRVERRELGLHVGRKRGIRFGGETHRARPVAAHVDLDAVGAGVYMARSEEHTPELQSLKRISYSAL